MKIMIIEATAEDLRASGSLKDAFNGLLRTLFDGSGQQDPEPEEPKPDNPKPAPVADPEEHKPERVTLFNAPETPESAAPSMVETPEAKPAPAKRPVDWGKAKALRKAGWSLAKIADELGVSVPTVSQHLKEVK